MHVRSTAIPILAMVLVGLGSYATCASAQLTPVIGVNPTSLDFGCVDVGFCDQQTVNVSNDVVGTTLEILELNVTGGDFSLVQPTPPFSIEGGQSTPVVIQFCPASPGPATGNLEIVALEAVENPVNVPLSGTGNQPPVCDAGGPYSGNVGDTIQFDGTGSSDTGGTIVAYDWEFGDGGTASGATPTHVYNDPGLYTVTLTVSDDCGTSSSCTATADIAAVNQPPICDAGGPYAGNVGDTIIFDGSGSSDPDGTITAYDWEFGDGASGTGVSPTHVYTMVGLYTVTLTVTDDAQASSSCATTADIVEGNVPPICDAGGPYSGVVDEPVQFDGSGSNDPDGTITAYDWEFGDGGSGTGVAPTHVYTMAGLYTVTLTVTDDAQATSSCATTADIEAANLPPICDAGGPHAGNVGGTIQFDGSGSSDPDGTITAYDWEFGDGATGSGVMPTHVYTVVGLYTVTLTVTDDAQASSSCATTADIVEGNIPPICDAGGPYSGLVGDTITFDGSGSSDPDGAITAYDWEFGDGGSGTGVAPTHVYTMTGLYTVTLTVTDDAQASSSCATTAEIGAVNEPPICDADGPYMGNVGDTITFDGSGSSDPDGTIVAYDWEFGDGGSGTGVAPTHVYTMAGLYTVTLTVTDDAQASSSCATTAEIMEVGNLPPVCDADGPYSGFVGDTITFDGSGSSDPDGTITAYDWEFGDGGSGTGVAPTHVYTMAGNYTVTLTVTDDMQASSSCTSTASIAEPGQEACPFGQGFWRQQCEQRDNGATKVCYEGMEHLWRCVIDATNVVEWQTNDGGTETTEDLRMLTDAELFMRLCMQLEGPRPMLLRDMVERQYLALQLNVCSNLLPLAVQVELPDLFTGTVAEAIAYIEMALNSGDNLGRANYIADLINNGEGLMAPHCEDPQGILASIPGCDGDARYAGTVISGAPGAVVSRAYPNPVIRGSATVVFTVTSEMGATQVDIGVYDVSGRLVRELQTGVYTPGEHAVAWDLTDRSGLRVPAGVYFYRLAIGDQELTLKQLVVQP